MSRSNNKVDRERGKSTKKKIIIGLALSTMIFALGLPVEAQQPKKIPRIGYFSGNSASADLPRVEAFRQGLRALAHVEGQNIAIEYRYTDGKFERLTDVAAELVGLKVDVLVAVTTNAALAAKNATRTIPIVFMGVSDPVEAELVDSLARPGGNVTGLTNLTRELGGKRLELLKEAVPKLARVAVLYDPATSVVEVKEVLPVAAHTLGLTVRSWEVRGTDGFEKVFAALNKGRPDGVYVPTSLLIRDNKKRIVAFS